jgi:hypothetical protein
MTIHLLPPPDADGADPDIRPGQASELLNGLVDHLAFDGGPTRHVATGISAVDDIGGGLYRGSLTAVVSPPDTRPTRLLLEAALYAARDGCTTYFYELDQGFGRFVGDMAAVVGKAGPEGATMDHELRAAARDLAQLPLRVAVGYAVGIHDMLAVTDDEDPVDLVVVDNCDLLLPTGDPRDLKRLATHLDIAVLCSAVRLAETGDAGLGADLLAAADTIVRYGPDGGCRVIATRMAGATSR